MTRRSSALAPLAALALGLVAGAAGAETPLSGPEFEARVTGRTLDWGDQGAVFGREQYLQGRQVRWSSAPGSCETGHWWEDSPGLICFAYDGGADRVCWHFFDHGGQLAAQPEGVTEGFWSEQGSTAAPLSCPGPMVGV